MKHLFIILSLLVASATAQECGPNAGLSPGEKNSFGEIVSKMIDRRIRVIPIKYQTHDYLGFLYDEGDEANLSVLHSPDCPCAGGEVTHDTLHVIRDTVRVIVKDDYFNW